MKYKVVMGPASTGNYTGLPINRCGHVHKTYAAAAKCERSYWHDGSHPEGLGIIGVEDARLFWVTPKYDGHYDDLEFVEIRK